MVASVVVFETEVGNQIFTTKMPESVLQLHQLDEHIMFRIEFRRSLWRLKIEGKPLLNSFHAGPLRQVQKEREIENDRRG